MTSLQVYFTLVLMLVLPVVGCTQASKELTSPYPKRQVWAVAPLGNLSGSSHAQVLLMTDQLRNQLATISGIDVQPLDNTLAAMRAMGLDSVDSQGDAKKLLARMNVDGLVVGAVTAYDPYDPPKIGMTVELYLNDQIYKPGYADPGHLTRQATASQLIVKRRRRQPVASVSQFVDSADRKWRDRLESYTKDRGQQSDPEVTSHLYRISIDLYSQFVSYEMSLKLVEVERLRLIHEGVIPKPDEGSILP